MEILQYSYLGNSNVGIYATVSNEQAIFPPEFGERKVFDSENTVETYIARTRLVGLFTAGNSNCILVPDIVTEAEKRKLEESGVEFHVLETDETALGNMILANDNGAVISENLREKKEEIEEKLGVDTKVMSLAGTPNPGSCGVANSTGALLHRDISEDEAETVKEVLEVDRANIGTVNVGSPYVGSGVLTNDNAVVTGEDTTGPEIGRIDRTLVRK